MSKLTGAALDRAVAQAMGLKSVHNCEKWGKHMTTIEFMPFEWDDDGFNPEIDRIEVDYEWHEGDDSVGLIAYCEKTVKWMRDGKEFKDITDELSYADLAYLKHEIQRNDQEIASERAD